MRWKFFLQPVGIWEQLSGMIFACFSAKTTYLKKVVFTLWLWLQVKIELSACETGTIVGYAFCGRFSKGSIPHLREFGENHGKLRQARPGLNPATPFYQFERITARPWVGRCVQVSYNAKFYVLGSQTIMYTCIDACLFSLYLWYLGPDHPKMWYTSEYNFVFLNPLSSCVGKRTYKWTHWTQNKKIHR